MLIRSIVFLIAVGFAGIATSSATIIVNLEGRPGSSILNVSIDGSGVALASFGSAITGFGFTITDGFDPFPPAIHSNSGRFSWVSGGGIFSNLTTGTNLDIPSLFLQDRSLRGLERFGVSTTGTYRVSAGDTISITALGTIDLSSAGLTFSSLTQGSGAGLFMPDSVPVNIEGRLNVRNLTIPEPNSMQIFSLLAIVGNIACVRGSRRGV